MKSCAEIQRLIFVERDRALGTSERATLDAHVGQCPECHTMRAELEASSAVWRSATSAATPPAVEPEWRAIRNRIRSGDDGVTTAGRHRWAIWGGVPLAAAAALAIAALVVPEWFHAGPGIPTGHVAHIDSVELEDSTNSVVYVDEVSGWLVVWAGDSAAIGGT